MNEVMRFKLTGCGADEAAGYRFLTSHPSAKDAYGWGTRAVGLVEGRDFSSVGSGFEAGFEEGVYGEDRRTRPGERGQAGCFFLMAEPQWRQAVGGPEKYCPQEVQRVTDGESGAEDADRGYFLGMGFRRSR